MMDANETGTMRPEPEPLPEAASMLERLFGAASDYETVGAESLAEFAG